MEILVCAKVIKGELNPFDACAVECALQLKDKGVASRVTVLTMGPPSAENALVQLTRLGVDCVLLCGSEFAGADTLATAYTLSVYIKSLEHTPELIICGRQSIDGDTAQVGPCLSSYMDFSLITNVLSFEYSEKDGGHISALTRLGAEECQLPAIMTVERINVLRFPSIRSKVREIVRLSPNSLDFQLERCGLRGSPTRVLQTYERTEAFREGKRISPDELPELLETLRDAEREPLPVEEAQSARLPLIYAIGHEVGADAERLAERVVYMDKTTAKDIAAKLSEQGAEYVLWNADLWGRRVAPQVAGLLRAGLCADCTRLSTDGEELFMYRPALGGNITAKIRCVSRPAMATVRPAAGRSGDILLGIGRGCTDCIPEMKALAQTLEAELGASRALVDADLMPYSAQIGLTGRSVAPHIYINIGVSGAVQHMCAVEGADFIIAINTDPDAPARKFADYYINCSAREIFEHLSVPDKEEL